MNKSVLNPEQWIDQHGDVLYRYALVRVGRKDVAEDMVQETLLAALRSQDQFRGASSERTWLVGIIRHKIVDHLRSRGAGMPQAAEDDGGAVIDSWFNDKGGWIKPPGDWDADPATLLERREFWEVFDGCLGRIPARAREAFARRVMEQEDAATVCKHLSITATNLWVILHRARGLLRACLEKSWFKRSTGDQAKT